MKTGKIFILFSVLAILIACLGLIGLVTYITNKRTREIGIRKTYGASITIVLGLLSKEVVYSDSDFLSSWLIRLLSSVQNTGLKDSPEGKYKSAYLSFCNPGCTDYRLAINKLSDSKSSRTQSGKSFENRLIYPIIRCTTDDRMIKFPENLAFLL